MDNQNREPTLVEQARLTLLEAEEKHLQAMSAAYKQVMDASRPLEDLLTVSAAEYAPLNTLHSASIACSNRLYRVRQLIDHLKGILPF